MRRLVLLTAVAVMAITAVAYAAVTNTLTYKSTVSYKGTPSKTKPAATTYVGTLHIDTDPPGNQPETAPVTSVYFSKGFNFNAKYYPFCNKTEIDGQPTLPAKCKKAIVGSGTATALAGTPGASASQSVKENLNVTAVNGPSGKNFYLVLNSTADAPVAITNRVVPATLIKSSGAFAYTLKFVIPEDLQSQLGLSISLTDFKVTVKSTLKKVKVGKVFKKLPYISLTSCKGSLPNKAIAQFKHTDDSGQVSTLPVTSTSSIKC